MISKRNNNNSMYNKSFEESSKKLNYSSLINKIMNSKELILEKLLENENYLIDLITNPNSPLRTFLTTDNIKILTRYILKFKQNDNMKANNNKKIIYNLCQVLCSPCVLLFKKSIHNIKYSNSLFNRYKNMKKKGKYNAEQKEEYVGKEENNLETILFKQIRFNNNIILSSFFCINENISKNKNKDNYVNIYNEKNSNEIEYINKIDTCEYNKEDIDIINEILGEIFNSSNFKDYENENYSLLFFQKLVNFLLYFESDTIIIYLIKDTPSEIINFLMNNINRAEILNILENILNILSDNADKEIVNNSNIYHLTYINIIQNLVNILIEDNQNKKFTKVDHICELIINTVINNSEKQLIELFITNNCLMKKIKKLISDIVKKNSIEQISIGEIALVNVLKVLCQLNNVIITSFTESNFYKENKKDININHIIYNEMNIFEYKYSSKKTISYKNIFKAFESNSDSYLSILNDIFILISKDIKKGYELNLNNKNKDNQKIGLNNLIKWKFIVSSFKLYIYSFYAIKEFNTNNFQYFLEEDLLKIAIQNFFNFPQNNFYLNIFLELIQLICCEKCPEFLINPFLKKKDEKENEFIFQLKKSLEIFLKRIDLI